MVPHPVAHMSEPRVLAEFTDYDGLIEALRRRKAELDLSFELIDAIGGLQSGYSAKVLGPGMIKKLGPVSAGAINDVLAVKFVMVEDVEAAEAMKTRWQKRGQRYSHS